MTLPTPQSLVDTQDNRTRIINAARDLATEIGYQDVVMTAVAKRADVGRATLYRYYATKEHLYADVTLRWGYEFARHLSFNPPRGRTIGACIKEMLTAVVKEAEENPNLIAAQVSCSVATDSGAQAIYSQTSVLMPNLLDIVMGNIKSRRKSLAYKVINDLIQSNYINLSTGKVTGKAIIKELVQVTEILLDDVWHKPKPKKS